MTDRGGTGRSSVAAKVAKNATCDGSPVRRTVSIRPRRSELAAAKINTAASVGDRDLPDDPGEQDQDQQHPDAGEDRRPASARACGEVQRGLADRAADRLAAKQPRGDVADPLCDEVAVRVGPRAPGVRRRLGHAGALDQHDHSDGRRRGDQIER